MMITHLISPAKAIRDILLLTIITAAVTTTAVGSTTRNIVRKNEEDASSSSSITSSSVMGDSSSSQQQHRRSLMLDIGVNEMMCNDSLETDGSIICAFRIMSPTTAAAGTTTSSSSSTSTNPNTLVHDCLMGAGNSSNFCLTAEVYPFYYQAKHQQATATAAATNNNPPPPPTITTTTIEQQQQQQQEGSPSDVDVDVDESVPVTMAADVCVADRDCHTSSPDSTADDLYCAAGTCLHQGGCRVDTDCVNPSNNKFKDTNCVGYLFCDTSNNTVNGRCARKCTGFACPGEVPATTCTVTGCETRIGCPGSVNCVVDHCDAKCKGLFFDSAGMVLKECTGGKGGGASEQTPPEQQDCPTYKPQSGSQCGGWIPTDANARNCMYGDNRCDCNGNGMSEASSIIWICDGDLFSL